MLNIDFLGSEFLTWLCFQMMEDSSCSLGKNVILKPLSGDGRKVSISTPNLDDSGELLQAIRSGYYVDALSLEYTKDSIVHTFTLHSDASYSGVKTDGHGKSDGESEEADLILRMANLDEVEDFVHNRFAQFLTLRLGITFASKELKAIRDSVILGLKAAIEGR